MSNSEPEEYEVEAILDHQITTRGKRKEIHYYIKWSGYSDADNTWEREENVYAMDLIIKYWDAKPLDDPQRQAFEKINSRRKNPIILPSSSSSLTNRVTKEAKVIEHNEQEKKDKGYVKSKEGNLTDMFQKTNDIRSAPVASTSKQHLNDNSKSVKQASLLDMMSQNKETADYGEQVELDHLDYEGKGKGKEVVRASQLATSQTESSSTTLPVRRTPEVIAVEDDDDDDDDDDVEHSKAVNSNQTGQRPAVATPTTIVPTPSTSISTTSSSIKAEEADDEEDEDYEEEEEEEEEMQIDLTDEDEEQQKPARNDKNQTETDNTSLSTVSSKTSAPATSEKQRTSEEPLRPLKRKRSVGDYFLKEHEKKMRKLSQKTSAEYVEMLDTTHHDLTDVDTNHVDVLDTNHQDINHVDSNRDKEKTRSKKPELDDVILDQSFGESRDWNTMAEKVVYIGRETAGSALYVVVRWKDGKQSLHPLEAIKEKIPLMIIDYFSQLAK